MCGPTRASLLVGRRPDTLRTVTHTKPTYWRERAGQFQTIPEMFRRAGWHTVSFGKVFDLRTSSYNQSAEWICDGPFSWSEVRVLSSSDCTGPMPALYCQARTTRLPSFARTACPSRRFCVEPARGLGTSNWRTIFPIAC